MAVGISHLTGMTTDQWCEKFGIVRCNTIAELVEKSDYIIVLSPDNCEMHYELSHEALSSGKPVYVDKTFAESKAEALRIFAAGPSACFSSSALRFSEKLKAADRDGIEAMVCTGPGQPVNYLIHQLEPVAMVMGTEVADVCWSGRGSANSWLLRFRDGRSACINMLPGADFEFRLVRGEKTQLVAVNDPFFQRFIEAMLEFFRTEKAPVDHKTTVAIMAIREACLKAMEQPGSRIPV